MYVSDRLDALQADLEAQRELIVSLQDTVRTQRDTITELEGELKKVQSRCEGLGKCIHLNREHLDKNRDDVAKLNTKVNSVSTKQFMDRTEFLNNVKGLKIDLSDVKVYCHDINDNVRYIYVDLGEKISRIQSKVALIPHPNLK